MIYNLLTTASPLYLLFKYYAFGCGIIISTFNMVVCYCVSKDKSNSFFQSLVSTLLSNNISFHVSVSCSREDGDPMPPIDNNYAIVDGFNKI